MNGRKGAVMSGVQRVEQRPSLSAAHLAQDDPIWPMPQRGLQQRIERNLLLVRVRLRLLLQGEARVGTLGLGVSTTHATQMPA